MTEHEKAQAFLKAFIAGQSIDDTFYNFYDSEESKTIDFDSSSVTARELKTESFKDVLFNIFGYELTTDIDNANVVSGIMKYKFISNDEPSSFVLENVKVSVDIKFKDSEVTKKEYIINANIERTPTASQMIIKMTYDVEGKRYDIEATQDMTNGKYLSAKLNGKDINVQIINGFF